MIFYNDLLNINSTFIDSFLVRKQSVLTRQCNKLCLLNFLTVMLNFTLYFLHSFFSIAIVWLKVLSYVQLVSGNTFIAILQLDVWAWSVLFNGYTSNGNVGCICSFIGPSALFWFCLRWSWCFFLELQNNFVKRPPFERNVRI